MVLLVILVAISVVQLRLLRNPEGTVMAARPPSAGRSPRRPHRRAHHRPVPRPSCSSPRSPGASLSASSRRARRASRRCRPGRPAASACRTTRRSTATARALALRAEQPLSSRWRRVLTTVVISLLAGYGFSRFRFPFKNCPFVLILSTIMIPFQSILTPLFLILTWLGLQNTLTGLVLRLCDAAAAVLDLHDAQRLRRGAEGDRGGGADRRRVECSRFSTGSCCRWSAGRRHGGDLRLPRPPGTSSSRRWS